MKIVKRIKACTQANEVFEVLWEHFKTCGFNSLGYMVPSREDPGKIDMDMRGFPQDFYEIYEREGLAKFDPFPSHVARHLKPLRLSQIAEETKLSREQQDYIERARKAGMTDGLLIPTFGVHNNVGIFLLGQVADLAVLNYADVDALQMIVQVAHTHLDRLALDAADTRPRLAPREVEILHWIAQGKTNTEIATIVGIGTPTVATYIKRLFNKLDVTDRAAAAVKGIKYGIISA